MQAQSSKDEVIRIRIESSKKSLLNQLCEAKGTTISEEVRRFLDEQLLEEDDALKRFDAVMESADDQLDAYGAPEPELDDLVAYVNEIRAQRSRDAVA